MKNFFPPFLLNCLLVLCGFATGTASASATPAVDLYTANYDGDSVLTVSAGGQASTLPATGLNTPIGLAFDQAGNLYVANEVDDSVSKITPGGVVSTFATGFSEPTGLAFDGAGNLYVANYADNSVYKVTPAGVVSTFVPNTSGLNLPWGLAFDSAGNLYVANYGGNSVTEVTLGGGAFTFATGFSGPIGLAFDNAGYLYVSNAKQGTVSKVTTGGTLSTFVSGGLSFPAGLAFDSSNNLYVVSEGSGTISTVTPGGAVATLTTDVGGAYMVAFGPPVAAQLQVLLPGETAAPGTGTGKTGTPIAQTSGGSFSVTVNAVDANFNLVAQASTTVAVSSSDSAAVLPANASLVNGTRTFSVTLNTGGPQTVTASDTAASPLAAGTSSSLNLNATAAVVTSVSSTIGSQTFKAGQTVPITVSFSAPVTVTGTPELTLNDGGTAIYASGSGTSTLTFDYTVGGSDSSAHLDYASTGALSLNGGTINSGNFPATLTLVVPGASGSLGANTTLIIDTTLPVVTITPTQTITAGGPVDFTATWSDANLNVSSISLAGPQVTVNTTGTVAYGPVTVTGTGSSRTVSVSSITGNGTIGISLPAGTALDLAGNAAAAAGPGTTVVVDNIAPTVTVSAPTPASTNAGGSVSYTVTYYDANFASASLNALDISLTNTAVTGTITVITNNSTNFTVVVSGLTGTGPQAVQISAGTAADLAGNSASAVASTTGFTVGAALATHLLVSLPATVTAGVAFNGTVTALDQFNNPVPGYSGEVHFTSTDGAAVLPGNATLANGAGSFSFTLNTLGGQTVSATDLEISSITGISGSVTVAATPATHLVVNLPASATAGVAVSGSVTALDQFNHLVTGYTNTVHFTSSDSAAVLPADMILAGGAGTANFTLKTAGSQTVSATDTSVSSVTGVSGTVTVGAAAATHLAVSLPGAAVTGTAFTGAVTALDAFGNTATSYAGTVHFTSSDSAAVLPPNATLVNGTGTFTFTLNTTGGQTVSAADTANTSISGISGGLAVGAAASGVQLYIANAGDDNILMLPSGGSLTAFAGGLSFPYGLAFDSASNLYVASFGDNTIAKITPGGTVSLFATNDLDAPTGLAFDSAGNLYAANFGDNTITKITAGGSASVFAGGMNQPLGLAFDGSGNLYAANGGNGSIAKITAGGSVSTFASGFADPVGLAMDTAGNLYVANYGSSTISKVTTGGSVSTFVAASAGLDQPTGLAIDSSGNLYVANLADGTISFVTPAGAVSTLEANLTGELSTPEFIAVRSSPVTTTTTVVVASANPAVAGQPVTFTATVSGGAGTPAGTVTFYDGATLLGTEPLTNGVAVVTTSGLAVGTGHSITAVYSGGVNFSASTSAILSETINSSTVATLTLLNASLNPAGAGQAVTFTATVSGSGNTPTGTVTFFDGATSLGVSTLTNGVATFTTASLGAGSGHGITAEYSGDLNFNGSTSASLTETINAAAVSTTTVVSTSANPAVFGQPVTFTATVSGTGGIPTGTVTFYDGSTSLGVFELTNGVAVYMTSGLAIGSGHSITGVYSGDVNFNASTSAIRTETVNLAGVDLLLSATNATVFGQPAVFTVTLNAAAPGAGIPTGTVIFYYAGTNSFATNTLAAGAAGITNADLPAGTNIISAVYSGDAGFSGGTVTATQVVNKAATTVLLGASATNSIAGQAVTFTATVNAVAPGAGTPAGTVTFYYDGTNSLGSNTLAGGATVLSSAALPAGANLITAVYSGSADFTAGTAPAVTEVTLAMTNGLVLGTGVVSNTGVLFRQTGLMQQQVMVTNLTAGTYAAVRLTVTLSATNKAAGITVADATGADTNGNPYLLYNYAVPPGGSVCFAVEYSVPNRTTIPNPVITVTAVAAAAPPAVPAGTLQPVTQAVSMADAGNAFLVGFRTQANATYYIAYSTNLVNWSVVLPAVKGNGSVVQWVDVGPPLTECPPRQQSQRFYKVIKAQ